MGLFKPNISDTEFFSVARQRVELLRTRSFADLAKLSPSTSEKVRLHDRDITICTRRDILPDGSVRVVVQAGSTSVDGFIMAADGTISAVPEEMWREIV
jgi:hypothetical protein